MNEHLLDIYCVATSLDDLLSNMSVEQAALVLRVPADANEKEIVKSYRRLVGMYHPDKPTGDALKFKLIVKARKVLLDNLAMKLQVKPTESHKKQERSHIWGDWYRP